MYMYVRLMYTENDQLIEMGLSSCYEMPKVPGDGGKFYAKKRRPAHNYLAGGAFVPLLLLLNFPGENGEFSIKFISSTPLLSLSLILAARQAILAGQGWCRSVYVGLGKTK